MNEVREHLYFMLAAEQLTGVPMLVLANKQDRPGALSATEIGELLGIDSIMDRTCHVQPCSAVRNKGLWEGLDWLAANVA